MASKGKNYNIWMVRAGDNSFLIDHFIHRGIVAVGWNEVGKVPKDIAAEELKQKLKNEYSDWSQGKLNQSAGQLRRFIQDFNIGDAVITYDSNTREYWVGEITSDYKFDKKQEYQHTRKVEWETYTIDRDDLSLEAKNLLGSILTLFEIPKEVYHEFEKLHPGYLTEEEAEALDKMHDEYEQRDLELIRNDVLSRSTEFIKDQIASLDWEDLELLVAGVLRGMGYKTLMSGPGPDTGYDILASPDGLGMENPRIKVEVKKRTGSKIGGPEIKSFSGGLRGEEKGLYVSTGGFSKDANLESERSNFSITLVDLDLLATLLTEHYENLDTSTKALIPLTKIYWPLQ